MNTMQTKKTPRGIRTRRNGIPCATGWKRNLLPLLAIESILSVTVHAQSGGFGIQGRTTVALSPPHIDSLSTSI